jgi:hypothetical protein
VQVLPFETHRSAGVGNQVSTRAVIFPKYEFEASFAPWQTVIKLDGKVLEAVRSYKIYSDSDGITRLELEIFPGQVLVSGEGPVPVHQARRQDLPAG